jgi:hypothetical protein
MNWFTLASAVPARRRGRLQTSTLYGSAGLPVIRHSGRALLSCFRLAEVGFTMSSKVEKGRRQTEKTRKKVCHREAARSVAAKPPSILRERRQHEWSKRINNMIPAMTTVEGSGTPVSVATKPLSFWPSW